MKEKIALINTTNSISKRWTTPTNEIMGVKMMLNDLNYSVDVISKYQDDNLDIICVDDVDDLNHYDKVLIIPGTFAFYHNDPKGFIFKVYSLLAKVKNPIYVLSTEVTVPLKQLYKQAQRFMDIDQDDINISAPIKFISLNQDPEVNDRLIDENEFNVGWKKYFNFDIFAAYCNLKNGVLDKVKNVKQDFDVIYGGAWRGGRRSDAFYNYLCDVPFKTGVYGTITQKQLLKLNDKYNVHDYPTILKKVPGNKVVEETSRGMATFVPGEKNMQEMTTARVWESMLSNAVTFIDESYDPNHTIMPASDFNYLHNDKQEFIKKIDALVKSQALRKSLVQAQHGIVLSFDYEKWLDDFNQILNS